MVWLRNTWSRRLDANSYARIVFDIISILVSPFGSSTFVKSGVRFHCFSVARILFFVHFFFVANRVRSGYKRWQEKELLDGLFSINVFYDWLTT
ncbi:unnamed protein product [Cylicocyclus nassatus]|uniref:Uncharacterized protein n=1 Tax=Cylicocyclus nassatus TaxID=53992 RepID=A0AA36GXZ7_CYLNA|nr:unnamed protein product [Cylicocyclus nassatus]